MRLRAVAERVHLGVHLVNVRSYRRGDGTRVRAHRRGAPTRKIIAGAAVAVSVTVAGVTLTISAPSGGSSVRGGGNARATTNEARAKSDFGRVTDRLKSKGYKVNLRMALDADCAKHSYGKVQGFFQSNPCSLLSRAVLEVSDKSENAVLVAVSRVDMPDPAAARQYKALVDRDLTGNVTELSRETGPHREVKYSGKLYKSELDGLTVRNSQVEPVVRGKLTTAVLKEILQATGK